VLLKRRPVDPRPESARPHISGHRPRSDHDPTRCTPPCADSVHGVGPPGNIRLPTIDYAFSGDLAEPRRLGSALFRTAGAASRNRCQLPKAAGSVSSLTEDPRRISPRRKRRCLPLLPSRCLNICRKTTGYWPGLRLTCRMLSSSSSSQTSPWAAIFSKRLEGAF